ncbi:hypothetical protein EVG20_g10560 [Dentipellis fragilis]|uniref:Transcription activator of gluconeogenesis ERT1 n=1 Tax=Dentipellis fragilis TaxID=205917 RepID=A0A4Y9XRN3_9AGAM|nr:hypothetical protein EVG20_g10560 [Dentipellis fragilis]
MAATPNAPNGLPPGAYMMPFPPPGLVYAYPPPPPPPAGYAPFPPPPAPSAVTRPKRKQVKMACTNCAAACKRCDEARPCERCLKYGIADSCMDGVRKERKKGIKRGPYKRKNKLAQPDNQPYNGYTPNGDGQWPPSGDQTNGGVPNGHPAMPPQFMPPPEGYYPYYYPPHLATRPAAPRPTLERRRLAKRTAAAAIVLPAPSGIPSYPYAAENAEGKNGAPSGTNAEAAAEQSKKKKRGRVTEDGAAVSKTKKAKRPAASVDAAAKESSDDGSPVVSAATINGNGTGNGTGADPHPPVVAAV